MANNDAEPSEDEGVKAIIYMQFLAGITEPEERARENWRKFSDYEKRNTMAAQAVMKSVMKQ